MWRLLFKPFGFTVVRVMRIDGRILSRFAYPLDEYSLTCNVGEYDIKLSPDGTCEFLDGMYLKLIEPQVKLNCGYSAWSRL